MYKNQLQELAQRSCFNLPSYKCIREGPDHAPRFKAVVNFNGENFESPTFCTTLRQAEHSAAEVALNALSKQGPSRTLAARVLDETGVYKNLLQETAHRAGLNLPVYTTLRSGPGHTPAFTCTVELAGLSFVGDPAKTKKKAEKNAALAAWSALKQLPQHGSSLPHGSENNEEQEQVVVARALAKLRSVDASKLYSLNDRSYGRRKAAPIWDDMNPANGALLHSVSVPYQSWVPSNLLPNSEMPQLWQDHSPRHLSHLRALPSPSPSPANDSRNVPCIQPTIGSAQGHYFPAAEQDHLDSCLTKLDSSSLFFSSYPSLVPPGGSSQVCIQEIQDEKTMRNEGKLDSGVSEVDRSIELNFQEFLKDKEGYVLPSSSGMPSEEENNKQIPGYTPVSNDCNSFVIPKSRSSRNVLDIQQGTGGCNSFELLLSGSTFSGPSSPNQLSFMPKNSGVFKSAQSVSNLHHRHSASCSLGFPQGSQHPNVAAQRPSRTAVPVRASPRIDAFRARDSFLASPVNIRTAIPVCSARPRGTPSLPSAVAPAVHVRSVTPVCSARPGGMNSSPSMSRAVAPAVHIRSVTHVCSARPGGTNSSQSLPVAVAPAVHVRSVTPVSSARPGGMNSSPFPSLPSAVVPAVHLKSVVPVCSAPTVKLPTSVEITAQELEDISTPTGRFEIKQVRSSFKIITGTLVLLDLPIALTPYNSMRANLSSSSMYSIEALLSSLRIFPGE